MTDTKPHAEHEGARTPLDERMLIEIQAEVEMGRSINAVWAAEMVREIRRLRRAGPGEAERLARTDYNESLELAKQRVAIVERVMKLPYIKATRDTEIGEERFVPCDLLIKAIHDYAKVGAQVPPATPAPHERIWCMECGKSVSTEVPKDTIVRAYVICPECIEAKRGMFDAAAPQPQEGAVLRPEQLIAVSFDPTQDASLPPKGRWIYLETALKTIDAVRKETRLEEAELWNKHWFEFENRGQIWDWCRNRLAELRALAIAHDYPK